MTKASIRVGPPRSWRRLSPTASFSPYRAPDSWLLFNTVTLGMAIQTVPVILSAIGAALPVEGWDEVERQLGHARMCLTEGRISQSIDSLGSLVDELYLED